MDQTSESFPWTELAIPLAFGFVSWLLAAYFRSARVPEGRYFPGAVVRPTIFAALAATLIGGGAAAMLLWIFWTRDLNAGERFVAPAGALFMGWAGLAVLTAKLTITEDGFRLESLVWKGKDYHFSDYVRVDIDSGSLLLQGFDPPCHVKIPPIFPNFASLRLYCIEQIRIQKRIERS